MIWARVAGSGFILAGGWAFFAGYSLDGEIQSAIHQILQWTMFVCASVLAVGGVLIHVLIELSERNHGAPVAVPVAVAASEDSSPLAAVPVVQPAPVTGKGWECRNCWHRNDLTLTRCEKCNVGRGG